MPRELDVLGQRAQTERYVTAAAVQILADWLAEQARILALEEPWLKATDTPSGMHSAKERPRGRLTHREWEVATRIARGLTNHEIACELVIARSTTERHVSNILNKLGMRSRAEVAAWAAENRLRGTVA
jgi:DNA-binding NarL/FixJ family response regulator